MMAYEPKTKERTVAYLELEAPTGEELQQMLWDVVKQGLSIKVEKNPNRGEGWSPEYSRLWFVITKEERVKE